MRGNTAQRLRLTLQGGCSTPRLIPQGRGISSPAPPTRALLRPSYLASKGTWEGRLRAPFPAIPSTCLLPAVSWQQRSTRRCKGEPSALPFGYPIDSPPCPRQASPGLPSYEGVDHVPSAPPGRVLQTPAMPGRRRAPLIASLLTPLAYPPGGAALLSPSVPDPHPIGCHATIHRSPTPAPEPSDIPCPTRSFVLRGTKKPSP